MYESDIRVTGTVVSSALGRASTGTEQVGVCFEYLDAQKQPQKITWYGYFSSEKATQIADEALEALGWKPADHQWDYYVLNQDGEENPIIGKKASLVLGQEDDLDGNPRLKVKFVNAIGGLQMKDRMTPDAAREFAARMRARVTGATPSAPRPKPAATPKQPAKPAQTSQDFDDIPFILIPALLSLAMAVGAMA